MYVQKPGIKKNLRKNNSVSWNHKIRQKVNLYTGCPTKHDSWLIVQNFFFHNLLRKLFDTKDNKTYTIWESCYCKICFKVKYVSKK